MMGLGYKGANKRLLHPRFAKALSRPDENLLELVIFGAIAVFVLGSIIAFLFSPPVDRSESFKSFVGATFIIFAGYAGISLLYDSARRLSKFLFLISPIYMLPVALKLILNRYTEWWGVVLIGLIFLYIVGVAALPVLMHSTSLASSNGRRDP